MSRWPLLLVLASMAPLVACSSRPFVVHAEHTVHGQLDLTLRTGPVSTKVDERSTPDGAGSAAYDHEQGRLTIALKSDGAEPSQVTQVTFTALLPQTSRGRRELSELAAELCTCPTWPEAGPDGQRRCVVGSKSYPACTPVTGHVDIRDLAVTCLPHKGQADACAKSIDLDVIISGVPSRASGTWVTAAAGTVEVKIEDHIGESTETDLDLGATH